MWDIKCSPWKNIKKQQFWQKWHCSNKKFLAAPSFASYISILLVVCSALVGCSRSWPYFPLFGPLLILISCSFISLRKTYRGIATGFSGHPALPSCGCANCFSTNLGQRSTEAGTFLVPSLTRHSYAACASPTHLCKQPCALWLGQAGVSGARSYFVRRAELCLAGQAVLDISPGLICLFY